MADAGRNGANCGVGASDLLRTILGLKANTLPLIAKGNAGITCPLKQRLTSRSGLIAEEDRHHAVVLEKAGVSSQEACFSPLLKAQDEGRIHLATEAMDLCYVTGVAVQII